MRISVRTPFLQAGDLQQPHFSRASATTQTRQRWRALSSLGPYRRLKRFRGPKSPANEKRESSMGAASASCGWRYRLPHSLPMDRRRRNINLLPFHPTRVL